MNNLMRTKESIDNLFSEFFHGNKKNLMKTDIKESEKEYQFIIEVPGLKKENLKINIEDGYLNVEGSKEYCEGECSEYIHKERYSENISRSYYVGKDIDEENIKAELKDGILNIVLPKKAELQVKKYITIE